MSSAEKSTPKAAAAAKKAGKPWLLIGAVVAVLAIGGGAAAWFMTRPADAKAEGAAAADAAPKGVPAPAQYFALEPVFVVNLVDPDGGSRYLQVEVQLMTRDPLALKDMELHAPAIRARLLMLFSQEAAEPLLTRAGKEKLQAAALAEVKKVLKAETGRPGADALLFTSFVMQ